MRLFIASPVRLYDHSRIKQDFEPLMHAKWVEETNLHLTWVFLGDLPDADSTIEIMRSLTPLTQTVPVASLGYFGRPPCVFFAKAEETLLYEKARSFRAAGFDLYRFKPHVTLCRIKEVYDFAGFKAIRQAYKEKPLGEILPQITLYRSILMEKGPEYEALFTLK